jgi:ubiquinone/menaquinone biosynthesis C-methylase UbiE
MPDLNYIYNHQAALYQQMVDCEDYLGNLLPAIQAILSLEGKDILETGAGTGRMTTQLASEARSLYAFDRSLHMLRTAQLRIDELDLRHVHLGVADHRRLPVRERSADLLISGWSVCYVFLEGGADWQNELKRTLADFRRCLRPGGKIILIETLGTGYEEQQRVPFLQPYLDYLEEHGFQMTWVRTDYCFANMQQARERIPFFFGEEMLKKMRGNILPECTGLWWL